MIKKIALSDVTDIQVFYKKDNKDDSAIQARFAAVTHNLREEQKKIGGKELSPFVDDFLYASCIMMHAAEASLIDQETGDFLKNAKNEPVKGYFQEEKLANGRPTVRWVSPDGVKPYRNNNLDIFPEADLIVAHKEWVGKPLCKDHISNSIDGVRGVIVDTYYDSKFKRVHALFALDKKNYPDLARKIEAGYATNVSMGTAVGRSICTECGNVATVANEFCRHVQARSHYGEINQDLRPIELSIVVTGADPNAKVRKIVASLDNYRREADEYIKRKPNEPDVAEIKQIVSQIDLLKSLRKIAGPSDDEVQSKVMEKVERLNSLTKASKIPAAQILSKTIDELATEMGATRFDVFSTLEQKQQDQLNGALQSAEADDLHKEFSEYSLKLMESGFVPEPSTGSTENGASDKENDFILSTQNVSETPLDSQMGDIAVERPVSAVSPMLGDLNMGTLQNFAEKKSDLKELERLASLLVDKLKSHNLSNFDKQNESYSDQFTNSKMETIKTNMDKMNSGLPATKAAGVGNDTGDNMSFETLRKRAAQRRNAYALGTEEPQTYPQMGDQDKIREQDKHLNEEAALDTSVDNPDKAVKEKLSRASIEERSAMRAAKLKALAEAQPVMSNNKLVGVVDGSGKVKPVQPAHDMDHKDEEEKEEEKTSKASILARLDEIKKEAAKKKKTKELEKFLKEKAKVKGKVDVKKGPVKTDKADKDDKAKAKDKKLDKKAYPQGTEELKAPYALMGDEVALRDEEAKKGEKLDTTSANPDLATKEKLSRAKLKARLIKGASVGDSRWEVLADDQKVLTVVASQAYTGLLDSESEVTGKTWGQLFNDQAYGKELLVQARKNGIHRLAEELGVVPQLTVEPEALSVEPDVSPADEMKEKLVAALGELEGAMSKLKEVVLGKDEGVSNVDAPAANMATASLDRSMFGAFIQLQALASELEYLVTDADLDNEDVSMSARSALRDARLARLETEESIEAYAEAEANCSDSMYALDSDEVDEVVDEVEEAIEQHDGSDLAHAEKVEELEDEITDLSAAVEEIEDMLKDMKEDEDADAYDKRAALRQQLVARASALDVTTDPLLNIHKGDNKKVDLGMSVADEGDVVEDAFDVRKKVMTSVSADVKKAAASLNAAIRKGLISVASLDQMVAVGAADAEAVKYYKEFYGKVDSEFASKLSGDFHKSASVDESTELAVRYKRAYNLALDAQARQVIGSGRQSLDETADSLVSGSDKNFEAFRRMVSQVKIQNRTAGVIPQAGVDDDFSVKTASEKTENVDIRNPAALSKALFNV